MAFHDIKKAIVEAPSLHPLTRKEVILSPLTLVQWELVQFSHKELKGENKLLHLFQGGYAMLNVFIAQSKERHWHVSGPLRS